MGELISAVGRLDVSPIIAILLIALSAALRTIGKGIVQRVECAEERIDDLEKYKHKHETSLAVIKTRLDIVEDDIGEPG